MVICCTSERWPTLLLLYSLCKNCILWTPRRNRCGSSCRVHYVCHYNLWTLISVYWLSQWKSLHFFHKHVSILEISISLIFLVCLTWLHIMRLAALTTWQEAPKEQWCTTWQSISKKSAWESLASADVTSTRILVQEVAHTYIALCINHLKRATGQLLMHPCLQHSG